MSGPPELIHGTFKAQLLFAWAKRTRGFYYSPVLPE